MLLVFPAKNFVFQQSSKQTCSMSHQHTSSADLGGGFVKCWITESRFLPSISPFLHECQIEAYWDDGCVAASPLLPLTCQKLFLEWKMLIKTLSMLLCNETFIRPGCILRCSPWHNLQERLKENIYLGLSRQLSRAIKKFFWYARHLNSSFLSAVCWIIMSPSEEEINSEFSRAWKNTIPVSE